MDNRSLRKEVETLMRTDLCRKVEIELSASKIGHLETENKALKEQIERTRDAACGTSTFQDQVQGSVDLVSARLHELQSKVEELKKDRVNGKGNRVEVAPVQEDERSCSAPQPRNPSKRKKVLISSGRLETAPVQEAEHVHFLPQLEKPSKRRKTLAPSDRPLAQEREKNLDVPEATPKAQL
ncbi:hypothetical protein FGG08_002567 [Glutinoglossum americanum]|uniref:Uncharacterized protein n=1 Tax=Glutinoglossum americanum TaxID=1670608 RepID=A0A9P8I8Y2_9PEZI|nr:hypothetical protein FGG08_002567 [Glutinoglossum americanum]